jgi:methylenetetrahydrofolate dehydrogenase (NADP+)/methenyltetrahydrofolate cyclohydrolase
MADNIIDGKAISAAVKERVKQEVADWVGAGNPQPGLATILVGDDPASHVYVGNKRRTTEEMGMRSIHHELPQDASQDEVADLIQQLNDDPEINGILFQLPAPPQIDDEAMTELIDPLKDVDGLTPISIGHLVEGKPGMRPCTPSGVLEMLDSKGVEIEGARAVVVGRSLLFGKPMAQMLLERNATVTQCHSRTRDLPGECRGADILIAAIGRPKMITADYVKEGVVVIDVGVNRTDDGLVGDVDFEAVQPIASLITPVPGGVGPMTIAMLLENCVYAASK